MVGVTATLHPITFTVGPLQAHTHTHTHTDTHTHTQTHTQTHTHTQTPWILPLLEAPAEGFCLNLPELGRRFPFDALQCCKTCPLRAQFQNKE
jgi:hypothetical protein